MQAMITIDNLIILYVWEDDDDGDQSDPTMMNNKRREIIVVLKNSQFLFFSLSLWCVYSPLFWSSLSLSLVFGG